MQNDKSTDLLNSILVEKAITELDSETDDILACKKALLTLILVVQDPSPQIIEQFISYLLKSFKPMDAGFVNHTHEFFLEENIMRGLDSNNKMKLFIGENLFKKLVKEYSKKN